MYRTGPAREGNVQSCDEDDCRIDGRRTKRDTIAAIVFDRKAAPAIPSTALRRVDEIRLRDGKVVTDAITAISRDEIATASGDFERSDVAMVLFAGVDAAAPQEILDDVLILRTGERRRGTLELCSGASCLLAGSSTPRATIEWIGLARGDASPPQSDRNTIHLANGEVLDRSLISITGDVLTPFGRYKRDEVAWIHLVPEVEEQPPINRFPPPPPPGPTEPPPPPPPPRGSPLPPPRGGVGSGDPCPASRPMGGYIELTESGSDVYSAPKCFHRNESRLWFRLVPSAPVLPWPARWTNSFHAPRVHYRITMGPCRGPYDRGGTCINPGGRGRGDLDLTPAAGNGMIIYSPFWGGLSVSLIAAKAQVRTVTRCSHASGTGEGETDAHVGSVEIAAANCADRNEAFAFCSNVTPCTETSAAADCTRNPQKYVVFPWEGSDSVQGDGPFINTSVRWKVCCGCGEPPEGGMDPIDRPPPKDPCDEIAALERRLRELQDARAQFARDLMAAQHRQKTVLLTKILSADGAATETLIALVSLLANATPLGKVGDALGTFIDGYTLGQEPNPENVAAAIVGLASSDIPFDAIENAAIGRALDESTQYLKRTGDHVGALRQYERSINQSAILKGKGQKVAGALGVIVAAKGLYDKSGKLGDALQDFFEAGDDVKREQNGLDDADNQIRDVMMELERLKAELEEPCATASHHDNAPGFVLAGLSGGAAPFRLVQASGGASGPDLTRRIAEIRAAALEAEKELAAAAPYILLFANAEARRSADPRLLLAMATEFRKRVLAADVAARKAADLAQRVVDDVKREELPSTPASTARGPAARPAAPARAGFTDAGGQPSRSSRPGTGRAGAAERSPAAAPSAPAS